MVENWAELVYGISRKKPRPIGSGVKKIRHQCVTGKSWSCLCLFTTNLCCQDFCGQICQFYLIYQLQWRKLAPLHTQNRPTFPTIFVPLIPCCLCRGPFSHLKNSWLSHIFQTTFAGFLPHSEARTKQTTTWLKLICTWGFHRSSQISTNRTGIFSKIAQLRFELNLLSNVPLVIIFIWKNGKLSNRGWQMLRTHEWTYCVCGTVTIGPFPPNLIWYILFTYFVYLFFHLDLYGTPIQQDSKQFTCTNRLQ